MSYGCTKKGNKPRGECWFYPLSYLDMAHEVWEGKKNKTLLCKKVLLYQIIWELHPNNNGLLMSVNIMEINLKESRFCFTSMFWPSLEKNPQHLPASDQAGGSALWWQSTVLNSDDLETWEIWPCSWEMTLFHPPTLSLSPVQPPPRPFPFGIRWMRPEAPTGEQLRWCSQKVTCCTLRSLD